MTHPCFDALCFDNLGLRLVLGAAMHTCMGGYKCSTEM